MRGAINSALRWFEPRHWLVILPLLAGLVLRPGLLGSSGSPVKGEDGRLYYAAAVSAEEHGVFRDPRGGGKPYSYRTAYYPAFLSLFTEKGSPAGEKKVSRVLAAVSLLLILLTFYIVGSSTPNLLALGAAFFMAFSGPAVRYGADVEIQGFFALMVAVFLLAGINHLKYPSLLSAALWGLSAGLALHLRSAMLGGVIIALFFMLRKQNAGRHISVFLLACLPLLAPWTVRNYLQFGRFVPFEDGAGLVNLYTATLGLDTPVEDSLLPFREPEKRSAYERSDNKDRARILEEEIRENLFTRPGEYLAGVVRRFFKIAFKFPLLIPGILVCFIRKEAAPVFLAVFCVYFAGVHSLMSVQGRYLFPMLTAVLALSSYLIASMALAAGINSPPEVRPRVRFLVPALVFLGLVVYARELFYLSREFI